LPSFERLARGAFRRLRTRAADVPYFAVCYPSWVAAKRELGRRSIVDVDALRAARRSDRVFIFGSSASLNDIGPEEWERIAEHDVFGFNWFVRQDFVRCDFHLIRQIADSNDRRVWEPQITEYFGLIERSPHYEQSVLLVQHEWRARAANLALQMGTFPRSHRVFPWHTRHGRHLSYSFEDGLVHLTSSLCDTVNAAFLMGWSEIVLVGVDLYDRRYFWLPAEETRTVDLMRGAVASDPHTQASSGLIDVMGRWRHELARRNVSLVIHNPDSLLADVLPVFSWA